MWSKGQLAKPPTPEAIARSEAQRANTVKLARAFLAMDARAACDGEDARDAARYR